VFVPLLTVGVSLLVTLAWTAAVYGELNQVTVAAPPELIVVGFAYSIHVLSAYYDSIRGRATNESGGESPVEKALGDVVIPVFFTGVTTAAGFLSLMTSPLPAIFQFGAFCGIGDVGSTTESGPRTYARIRPRVCYASPGSASSDSRSAIRVSQRRSTPISTW
jgi:predicted RND superfamily exporter protein